MWKLARPDVTTCEQEFLRALCDASGAQVYPFTDEQRQGLLLAYDQYDARLGRASNELLFHDLGTDFLQAMRDAYHQVQEGKRLDALRARLKIAARKCPYCGFGEVSDLDHHLPRSVYHAFAIYARNLVPCCHRCNNKKRAVAGETPDSQFVHVYLDELPDETFLVAEMTFTDHAFAVSFAIVRSRHMSPETFDRLRFQFARLELNARYQAEVVEFMSDQRTAIMQAVSAGPQVLKQFLARSRENAQQERGLNHWKTARWSALLVSDEFIAGDYTKCFGDPTSVSSP